MLQDTLNNIHLYNLSIIFSSLFTRRVNFNIQLHMLHLYEVEIIVITQ